MKSDSPPEEDNPTVQQQNSADNSVTIKNSGQNNSVEVRAENQQNNNQEEARFPDPDRENLNTLSEVFDLLISTLPVDTSIIDRTVGGSLIASLVIVYLVFSNMMPASASSEFSVLANAPTLPLPDSALFFAMAVILTGSAYLQQRKGRSCPDCDAPLGLRVMEEYIDAELSDNETKYGEKVLECKECGYTEERKFSKKK